MLGNSVFAVVFFQMRCLQIGKSRTMVAKNILCLDSRVTGYMVRIAGSGVDAKRPLMDANADRVAPLQRLPREGNIGRYQNPIRALFQHSGHKSDHQKSLREPKT